MQLFLMPPVVQIHDEYTKLVRTACVKTGYQTVPLHTYIHTEKLSTEVTKIRLATLAPISLDLEFKYIHNLAKVYS